MVVPDESIVTLISSDQIKMQIPAKAVKHSSLVATTLFPSDENNDDEDPESASSSSSPTLEMELPRVEGVVLEKIVEFLLFYDKNPFPSIMPDTFVQPTFQEVRIFYQKFNFSMFAIVV
jgi:hypothetical protein